MSVTIAPSDCGDEITAIERGIAVNFANANARPVLAIMADRNPLRDYWADGELLPHEIPAAIERVSAALGTDVHGLVARAPMLRAQTTHALPGCARVIVCGSDDARACERLRAVLRVLTSALARNVGVRWY